MAPTARKVAVAYDDGPLVENVKETHGTVHPGQDSIVTPLREVAVLPSPSDNCAIASRTLQPGRRILLDGGHEITLPHTVLEGHRFAVEDILPGDRLTSWGLGFGTATGSIKPGDYCCNDSILAALRERSVQAELPLEGCFENYFDPLPDPSRERDFSSPGVLEVQAADTGEYGFSGFERPGGRGVGTRNYIVLLGTTIHSAPFVRRLERKFRGAATGSLDGIVAVSHTEGHAVEQSQNWQQLVRCMAGFIVHPNVAACVVVDHPSNPMKGAIEELLSDAARYRGLDTLPLRWLTIAAGDLESSLEQAAGLVRELIPSAVQAQRSWQPAKHLVVAQQCGGSDAFSGVNGNPASAGAVRRLIAAGGKSVLAETDELIGAESYVLARIRDRETEAKYLELRQRYHEYARRHGHSAEGNPSGGNKFRGLYNIALKSLGAAMKKPPDIRLEGCLEYGERLVDQGPGYFFMDSPGNDPESIAGQVASGCNLVHFITGNGSITNFPFVPTIKIITTASRWELLSQDMDFNAGRLQQGETLDDLAKELFDETLCAAGGRKTVGEKAEHWQVCIWRDWHVPEGVEDDESRFMLLDEGPVLDRPLLPRMRLERTPASQAWEGYPTQAATSSSSDVFAARALALLLPTSLCAGQVALQIAEALATEAEGLGYDGLVALPHTEGCGCSSAPEQESIFRNVMLGHLLHPSVRRAVLLEHGCEKTHNDWFHARVTEAGRDPHLFGWASIQLDGGIEKVKEKVKELLFSSGSMQESRREVGLRELRIGIAADHKPEKLEGLTVAAIVNDVVRAGGCVVAPHSNPLLASAELLDELLEGGPESLVPTLRYAESLQGRSRGFHVMQCPGRLSLAEQVTGLAACGLDVIVALTKGGFIGSPVVPVLQVSCTTGVNIGNGLTDVAMNPELSAAANADRIWDAILPVLSGRAQPLHFGRIGESHVDFVIPRGLAGISL
mmetsp:Transcript_29102/g.53058  ORF Transcript_29102/g.53058 Transcript_29102/m.53058 type:complete len:959 (+) Transcript_29102:76-2952(+)